MLPVITVAVITSLFGTPQVWLVLLQLLLVAILMQDDSVSQDDTLELELPPLHPLQREVVDSPFRFRVLVCGRRWGKTRLGVVLALIYACAGRRVWWVAPIYAQSQVAWRLMRGLLGPVPGVLVRASEHALFLPGGGEIWFKSSDQPDNLRGEGLDLVILDEADYQEETVWTRVLRPALADKKGDAVFLSTPRAVDGWFHGLFNRGQSDAEADADWVSWQYASVTNPYLDPAELEEASRDLTPLDHAREFGAQFVMPPDAVYYTFDRSVHVDYAGDPAGEVKYNPDQVLYVGFDFNNQPRVAVYVQFYDDTIWVVDELWRDTSMPTDAHAQLAAEGVIELGAATAAPFHKTKVRAVCDASGSSTLHSGRSDHEFVRAAGFFLDTPDKNPPVVESENAVLVRFRNKAGESRCRISRRCTRLIQALQRYETKHRKDRNNKHGHVLDAFRYVVHRVAPVQTVMEYPDPFATNAKEYLGTRRWRGSFPL